MGVCEDIDSAWFETVSSTKQYLAIRKATESTVANNGWTQVPHIVLIAAPPIRLPGDVYAYIGWVNALRDLRLQLMFRHSSQPQYLPSKQGGNDGFRRG